MKLEPMSAFFNRLSGEYDELVRVHHKAGGQESKDRVAQLLLPSTYDILDLGCGTGLELPAIFARFPNARVVGIDLAEDMLAILKERCTGFGVQTLCMSYFDYDFPANEFDAVISVMSLHHFTPAQKLNLYSQVRSTLKPGGMFLNCDHMIGSSLLERKNFRRLRRLKCEPGVVHFDTPLTAKHELNLLRQAGFTQAEVVWRTKDTKTIQATAS